MIKKTDKKIFKILIQIFSLVILFVPSILFAKGLITCGAVNATPPEPACDFNQLIATINKIIEFLLIYFATPLAAICFAYAGFLYITSAGSSENVSKAKTILKNVIIG